MIKKVMSEDGPFESRTVKLALLALRSFCEGGSAVERDSDSDDFRTVTRISIAVLDYLYSGGKIEYIRK
jgi:hypothetical protein